MDTFVACLRKEISALKSFESFFLLMLFLKADMNNCRGKEIPHKFVPHLQYKVSLHHQWVVYGIADLMECRKGSTRGKD